MIHELKILPCYYNEVLKGNKAFEYRKDDRGFKVGDLIILNEWNNDFTGRSILVEITYILKDVMNLPKDYVILSIRKISKEDY